MGRHTNSRAYNIIAWTTVVVVAVLSSIYLALTLLDLVGIA
jgi:Mn2+/Fe2+ NRAMP family transporter